MDYFEESVVKMPDIEDFENIRNLGYRCCNENFRLLFSMELKIVLCVIHNKPNPRGDTLQVYKPPVYCFLHSPALPFRFVTLLLLLRGSLYLPFRKCRHNRLRPLLNLYKQGISYVPVIRQLRLSDPSPYFHAP